MHTYAYMYVVCMYMYLCVCAEAHFKNPNGRRPCPRYVTFRLNFPADPASAQILRSCVKAEIVMRQNDYTYIPSRILRVTLYLNGNCRSQ